MDKTEWPEEMDVNQANEFIAAHGVTVPKHQLRDGNGGWPKCHKLADGRSRRWRRDELEAVIAKRKGKA